MKKIFYLVIALSLIISMLAGCGNNSKNLGQSTSGGNTDSPAVKATSSPSSEVTSWKSVLYFSDKNAMNVLKEERDIKAPGKLDAAGKAKLCIEELVKGPNSKDLSNSIPKSTKVNSVKLDQGNLTVDLSKEFDKDHSGGSAGVNMSMAQLVLTLTELEGVKQVSFLIDGKVVSDFKGLMDFKTPFKRTEFEQMISK